MTTRTLDRDASAFFTPDPVGVSQTLTPEGFLLCKNVRIARLGMMMYTQHDLPHLTPGDDGFIRVTRDEDALFHPDALSSFEGKPVTNDHPDDDVNPDNWKQIAVGTTHNVRRGAGIEDQYMIADLLITDREAIEAVRDGKREVSNGYDADYLQTQPGHARQHNIIGNHVALVERGRCGPRCAIQDKETKPMTKPTIGDRIKAAFLTRDEKALDAALGDVSESGQPAIHIHNATKDSESDAIAKLQKTVDSLTSIVEGLAKDKSTKDEDEEEEKKKTSDADEDEDEKKKTEDELFEEEEDEDKGSTKDAASEYANIVTHAEIIAPGFKLPTMTKDAQSSKKKTRDALCACKRRALDAALKTEDGKKAVTPLLRGRALDKMSAEAIDATFYAAAEVMRAGNNSRVSVQDREATKTVDAFAKGGIDKINAAFWAKK